MEEQNRRRLEAEDPIKRARTSVFRLGYSAFASSYSESPRSLIPSERFILKTHEGVKDVIQAEGTDTSTSIFDNVFNDLPDYLNKWRKERKLELTGLVLKAQNGPGIDVDIETAEEQGILNLATSVFATCGYGDTFAHDGDTVHWIDSVGEHSTRKLYHTPSRKSPLPYNEMQCIRVLPNLVEHVKLLVQAVGSDPSTFTAEDMDKLDARFYCDGCSAVRLGGEVFARSWRNCVSYDYIIISIASDFCISFPNIQINHIGFHSKSKPWKGWTLLSPEDRAVIAEHEKSMDTTSTSASQAVSLNGKRIGHAGGRFRYRRLICCRRRVSGGNTCRYQIPDERKLVFD